MVYRYGLNATGTSYSQSQDFCNHGNKPIYYNGTDICAHVYKNSFTIQSTTGQILLDGELLTEIIIQYKLLCTAANQYLYSITAVTHM